MYTDQERSARIRALNDELRCHRIGGHLMLTSGIRALGDDMVARILVAIAAFDDFGDHNDPYGEHDCAVLTVCGVRIVWKIDYYDVSMTVLSPDPSDATVTIRVMTVMLASEY